MAERHKKTIPMQEWTARLAQVQIPKQQLNEIVFNFLTNEGYTEAALKFKEETGMSQAFDEIESKERMSVRMSIMDGDINTAIEQITALDPQLLDANPNLCFKLRLQKLVEYIKEGNIIEALAYGQEVLAPAARSNSALLQELERVMALMAFDNPENSPVASLVQISQRQQIASEVNEALLKSKGLQGDSKLKLLMKSLLWSQKKLGEHVSFPVISDLAEARFEDV
mmetsp:Transcript_12844/g.23903  ORF Transcript_12844/g.23903 Transcript_12844/m.23903 type:complete len:226 (-) Transcript_12844:98-775(-)